MKKALFSIVIVSALLMGIFTYAAIKRGTTTGHIIGDLTRNISGDYFDVSDQEKIVTENNVKIVNFAFSPIEIEINIEEIVLWENHDLVRHSIVSRDGIFDSGLIGEDETFSYKFESPGVYAYYCNSHPYMTGKVIVNDR